MGFRNGTGRVESVVGILLIAVLVLVVAGVFAKQFYYDKSFFITDMPQSGGEAEATGAKGFEAVAPAGFEAGTAEEFDEKSLYEKIDGKADLYLESGFKKLTCQIFTNSVASEKWFEFYVYDMGNALNAFSVYSVQKRPQGENIAVTDLAYKTPDAVFLCKGKYYCEIMSSALDETIAKAMLEAAEKFVGKFAGQAGSLVQLEIFSKEYLVGGSYKLYLAEAYGFDKFKNVFSAVYDVNGSSVTAFVYQAKTPADANEMAAAYRQFLVDNAQAQDIASEYPSLGGAVLDMSGFYEIVFAKNNFVAGVHETEDKNAGELIADKLYQAITAGAK